MFASELAAHAKSVHSLAAVSQEVIDEVHAVMREEDQ